MLRLTVAGLLTAAWLAAQAQNPTPKSPTDPGALHPMPIPKADPQPVPPGTQPDPNIKERARSQADKKAGEQRKKSETPKPKTESPKAKSETRPN